MPARRASIASCRSEIFFRASRMADCSVDAGLAAARFAGGESLRAARHALARRLGGMVYVKEGKTTGTHREFEKLPAATLRAT